MARGENFENAVRQLCSIIAKLDGDLCVAEGNLLFYNEAYRSVDSALKSMSSLQCLATTMVTSKHNLLYKHFYQMIVFLLTLPVMSASCERAHRKVDIVGHSKIHHDFREIGRFYSDLLRENST
jgi:hypothetical protein